MSAREIGAKALYEHWANWPACTASKSWDDLNDARPPQAECFRREADAIIAALAAAGYQIASPGDRVVKAGEVDDLKAMLRRAALEAEKQG